MEWKERWLIGREYKYNIGRHLAGMLKVRGVWSRPKVFSEYTGSDNINICKNDYRKNWELLHKII